MRRDLVNIWELKVSLSTAITDRDMADVRSRVREAVELELQTSVVPSSILWMTRGALLTVRTEGNPAELVRVMDWMLATLSPEPTEFTLKSMRTAPLSKTEGWQGYARG